MKQIDPTDTIAIGFQVQYQLEDGRAIAFSSCLDAECDPAQLNSALDKLMDAAARQQARTRLPKLKKEVARFQVQHERARQDMFRLDAEVEKQEELWKRVHGETRRGDFKYSNSQLNTKNKLDADRGNAQTTYERMEEEIKARLEEIEELESLVGPASANDSKSGL